MKWHSINSKDTSIGAVFKAKVAEDARGCWGYAFEMRLSYPLTPRHQVAANDLLVREAA